MHYLSEYQTFESKQQLNEAIADHLAAHRFELNDTASNVLTVISRYAVKFPGVAHLKAATIAQALGICEKTVRRAVNKLAALGIVRKVATTRKVSGGQGANIYVVQAHVSTRQEPAKPAPASPEPTKNDAEPYYSFKLIKNHLVNTYAPQPQPSHYSRFRRLLESTIGTNSRLLYRLYGVYKAQTAPLCRTEAYDREEREEIATIGLQALHAAIQATKRMKIRNLAGYYSGVLDRMLDRWQAAELYA
ncbi:helix-turn-helix domain-containing protein [Heyndrickxia coagulans]|uniref:Helix-turn-helix domain-containing protein n=1 Tax=Heyndrickxia coagulans TaxID=1398 RepID=A0AAW7CEM8_HEYCO|nr:helix-turn-helix domain-containing protein [Heyndrickxia coagulans]MDL5039502.1 helix-turn-helix domain-containing protein [Heyndrickxia coagulans]